MATLTCLGYYQMLKIDLLLSIGLNNNYLHTPQLMCRSTLVICCYDYIVLYINIFIKYMHLMYKWFGVAISLFAFAMLYALHHSFGGYIDIYVCVNRADIPAEFIRPITTDLDAIVVKRTGGELN